MYSQNLEETHILNYFGDYIGTFLDVGCNDCVTFSNTRALALKGWKGIFIDPSPKAMERCKTLYNGHKGYYFYEVAIRGHNGKDVLRESESIKVLNGGYFDIGLVSTFHNNEMERFRHITKYHPVEVNIFRWKTFQNRLKSTKVTSWDFISIDAEGDDLEILSQMDITKTRAICLEWNSKTELKKDFEHYLDGFTLLYTSGENLLYGRV